MSSFRWSSSCERQLPKDTSADHSSSCYVVVISGSNPHVRNPIAPQTHMCILTAAGVQLQMHCLVRESAPRRLLPLYPSEEQLPGVAFRHSSAAPGATHDPLEGPDPHPPSSRWVPATALRGSHCLLLSPVSPVSPPSPKQHSYSLGDIELTGKCRATPLPPVPGLLQSSSARHAGSVSSPGKLNSLGCQGIDITRAAGGGGGGGGAPL